MSLLDDDEIAEMTGIFAQHFPIFSTGNNIVVFKEPKKTYISISQDVYAGYEKHSQNNNFTTTPVSGVFPAIVRYPREAKETLISDIPLRIKQGEVQIKVQEDAANYISNGKTENILVNGMYFNIIADRSIQNYFGLKYYYFVLARTT